MILAFSLAATAGCGGPLDELPSCSHPTENIPTVLCGQQGSLGVSSDYALPPTVGPLAGVSCLSVSGGTCSDSPSFYFQSEERADGHQLNLIVGLPAGAGPGTYVLGDGSDPAGAVVQGGIHDPAYVADLRVVQGAVVVSRSDVQGLEATFHMELVSEDGLHRLSLTNGDIQIDGCHVEQVPTCVDHDAGA